MMRPSITSRPTSQRGAALIMVMFIIGLAVIALVMKSYDAAEMKARQDEKTMKALAEAKEALIAWSVTHPEFPGAMPYPDRGNGGGYDGESDCFSASNNFDRQFLIGMLPVVDSRDSNCFSSLRKGVSGNFQLTSSNMRGKYGERLWYAVSRNLIHNYEFSKITNKEDISPIINPGILVINYANPPFLRKIGKSDPAVGITPYPWLRIVNENGDVVADRVAAVIIAPGLPLAGQNRSSNNPPASEYLDAMIINGVSYSNADYSIDGETFLQAPESSGFNDRLIYITIDELMSALERRVVRDVKDLNFPKNMVRCTLSDGCKYQALLSWESDGAYVITPVGDASVGSYRKFNNLPVNCFYSYLDNNKSVMKCEAQSQDSNGIVLKMDSLMNLYPFSISNFLLTGEGIINVFKDGGVKGTVKPASNSTFSVSNVQEITSNSVGWPVEMVWYFNNKWYEYIYVVSEEFDEITNAGKCLSNCLILNSRNREMQNIKQLVFSRNSSLIKGFAEAAATNSVVPNYFYEVNKSDGAVAWKQ